MFERQVIYIWIRGSTQNSRIEFGCLSPAGIRNKHYNLFSRLNRVGSRYIYCLPPKGPFLFCISLFCTSKSVTLLCSFYSCVSNPIQRGVLRKFSSSPTSRDESYVFAIICTKPITFLCSSYSYVLNPVIQRQS